MVVKARFSSSFITWELEGKKKSKSKKATETDIGGPLTLFDQFVHNDWLMVS